MSTNYRSKVLARTKDSTGAARQLTVWEEDSSKSLPNKDNTIVLFPRMYSHFTFEYEYKNNPFQHADVYVTNRFTMDTVKFLVACNNTSPQYATLAGSSNYTQTSYIKAYCKSDGGKRSIVEVVLSMNDFMYGDIYVQFYDSADAKEQYCAPIIVQFTNAPTILQGGIYKWRPNLASGTSALYDYDNVFHDGYGAFGPPLQKQSDLGRTDVLTGNISESANFYYNDFMSANRLITNGYVDYDVSPKRSYSGHPTYVIEYVGIIPSAFSSAFGINQQPITFVPLNNEQSAYLTSSVDNITAMYNDSKSLTMTSRSDLFFPYSAVQMYSANDNSITTLECSVVKYIAHLTANSADRPDDEWFRKHTRVCADFVLSGLNPYWTGESEDLALVLTYDERPYYALNAHYTPPIFELSWYAAGTPTDYYLLRKNGNKNNDADWIQVFSASQYNKTYVYREGDVIPDSSNVNADNSIALTEENYHIVDNLPDLALDTNNRPIIKMQCGDTTWYSDDADAASHFQIQDETVVNNLKATVFRMSDWAGIDFSLDGADAEFIVIYNV